MVTRSVFSPIPCRHEILVAAPPTTTVATASRRLLTLGRKKMRKRKQKPKPPWIKVLVWRDEKWVVLDEGTFPVKKGEAIRMRGQRTVYEVQKDSRVKRDGSITIRAHEVGMLWE